MEKQVTCPDCEEGLVEHLSCFKPASECCGGCFELRNCDRCEGSGEVSILDLNEDELRTALEETIKKAERLDKSNTTLINAITELTVDYRHLVDSEPNDTLLGAKFRAKTRLKNEYS